jgi:hypothetical protein
MVKVAGKPVPEMGAVCGLFEALSVIWSEALRVPVAVGEKVMLTWHDAPAARVVAHVFALIAKSPAFAPVRLKVFRTAVTLPVFARLTSCAALVVLRYWEPKVIVDGRLSVVVAPLPVNANACGLFVPLSVMVIDAVRLPDACGENVTLNWHEAPAVTVPPQVLPLSAKSAGFAPVKAMLENVTGAPPVFWMETARSALVVDMPVAGKARLLVTVSELPNPVPVMLTAWGLPVAVSVICKEAVRMPGPVGVNVTLTAQLEAPPIVAPQVFALIA